MATGLLSRFAPDRPTLPIALPDGNPSTWEAYIDRYLPPNEEYDTYPVFLETRFLYDIYIVNDGSGRGLRGAGFDGLWTNTWLYDQTGTSLRYAEWSDPWPGNGYNGDILSFRPAYNGFHYVVVQKDYALYYDLYEGSYGIRIYAQNAPPGLGPDTVVGTAGNDYISLLDGADHGDGGIGNDTMDGGFGNDTLVGGPGNDFLTDFSGDDSILGGDGDDRVIGGAGNDDLNGNLGRDTVLGDAGADFVRGGQDADLVQGGDGDDWHVNGNIGNDTCYGDGGHDAVFGGPGDDLVGGFTGNDTLSGDLGNDTLTGDAGSDLLWGRAGADIFVFAAQTSHDLIMDFTPGESDRISLQRAANGRNWNSFADLEKNLAAAGNDTVLDLGAGNFVSIVGVARSQIGADAFLFW